MPYRYQGVVMGQYIARRLVWMVFVLFSISVLTFVLMRLVPGGPFNTERGIPEEIKANMIKRYNMDAPLYIQYLDYMGALLIPRMTDVTYKPSAIESYVINIPMPFLGEKVAFRWVNFGPSLTNRSQSVTDSIAEKLPASFQLGISALLVGLIIGVPIGIMSALNQNKFGDYFGMSIAIIGVSIPSIISGPLLQYIFGVKLGLLPVAGWTTWQHAILPSFALGFIESALIARLTRASLLQVLREDYIRTARAKGLPERVVIGFHALKNSLIPVATILGPLAAALLTGTFVVETIFGIPGLGRSFVTSVTNRDYTVIMGTVLLYAGFLVIANLLVDITYAFLDPRIRLK
jgi:oligopeptide transport system permease protein